MTAQTLLDSTRRQGVTFTLEGETLRFKAPKGVLSPALQEQLQAERAALMDLLRQEATEKEAGRHPPLPAPAGADEVLKKYARLIEQAERGELLHGKPMRLSCWETTEDLNRTVLSACKRMQTHWNANNPILRSLARAQGELLLRCQLAQQNGGDAIRPRRS